MRRRYSLEVNKRSGFPSWAILLVVTCCSCLLAYAFFSPFFSNSASGNFKSLSSRDSCCRGVENLELWGRVVVWGDKHYTNSSRECCSACKALCTKNGACECNSWVFCGDQEKCGNRFGQCWLKKQEDPLAPDIQASGKQVMWTSGLVHGRDTGVMGIETEHGIIHMKVLVDCAPYSVAYLLELQKLRHCAGCNIYRAEGRGSSWDDEGLKIGQTTDGPYGLLQGTLAAQTVEFQELPREACPVIQRGSVGWIGGGPDFFISLANHDEWYPKHTVFAHVLKEDMHIVEKIANLPTVSSTWTGVTVAVLAQSIPIKVVPTSSPRKVAEVAEVVSG